MKTIKWAVLAVVAAAALFAGGSTSSASEIGTSSMAQWHVVSATYYNNGLYRSVVFVYSDGKHFISRRFSY